MNQILDKHRKDIFLREAGSSSIAPSESTLANIQGQHSDAISILYPCRGLRPMDLEWQGKPREPWKTPGRVWFIASCDCVSERHGKPVSGHVTRSELGVSFCRLDHPPPKKKKTKTKEKREQFFKQNILIRIYIYIFVM